MNVFIQCNNELEAGKREAENTISWRLGQTHGSMGYNIYFNLFRSVFDLINLICLHIYYHSVMTSYDFIYTLRKKVQIRTLCPVFVTLEKKGSEKGSLRVQQP